MTEQILTNELATFIREQLQQHPHIECPQELSHSALSGDAGFRRYIRIHSNPSVLAVTTPPNAGISESARHFARLAKPLREQGIPTPFVLGIDSERNFLLLEDFGDELLLELLNEDTAELLYGEAMMLLTRLQQIPVGTLAVPAYDEKLLRDEMALFHEWFVPQLLGYELAPGQRAMLEGCYDFLVQQALAQPQVLVHRDYHSRNLIYREGEAPGVIDFQGALQGPITYDLVSLLRDCYIHWPQEKVGQWLKAYGNMAIELELMPEMGEAQWRTWFDTMGLQRHIKILGIFARLHLRDGKPGYLKDLPLTLRYVLEVAPAYKETRPLAEFVEQELLPLCRQQDWYKAADE